MLLQKGERKLDVKDQNKNVIKKLQEKEWKEVKQKQPKKEEK